MRPRFRAVLLRAGKPCPCGPDFCWRRAGIGGYGTGEDCDRARKAALSPVCPKCDAPGQGLDVDGNARCWNCTQLHADPPAASEPWERAQRRKYTEAAHAWLRDGTPGPNTGAPSVVIMDARRGRRAQGDA